MLDHIKKAKSRAGYKWWRLKRAVRSRLSTINEQPIIVLGNQKSGTTAIAALVAKRAGLSATLDLEEMTAQDEREMHRCPEGVREFIAHHKLEFSRDLIKEPRLTFVYPQLRRRFPDAQFVFIVRDPRANIRSILDRLGLPGDPSSLDRNVLRNIDPVWQLVVDGSWMGIEGEDYIERLSRRWNRACQTYLDCADEFVLVRYEDFNRDKVGEVDRVVDRLGFDVHQRIDGVVNERFQPEGNRRGMSWEDFYGSSNLEKIEHLCEKYMVKMGYEKM